MIDEEMKIIINDILCHTKEMIKFLNESHIPQKQIASYLDISIRQVRNALNVE